MAPKVLSLSFKLLRRVEDCNADVSFAVKITLVYEGLVVRTNLSIFQCCPFEPLDVQRETKQSREDDDCLQAKLLSIIMFRFGGPTQECHDILCVLGSCTRGTYNRL